MKSQRCVLVGLCPRQGVAAAGAPALFRLRHRSVPSPFPAGSFAPPSALRNSLAALSFSGLHRPTAALLQPVSNPPPQSPATSQSAEELEDELKNALRKVFYDVRLKLRSRVPIGDLFRLLEKENQKVLAKQRLPLEEFLLHFPHHFRTFRSKIQTNTGMIQVAPPYQAHPGVRQLQLPEQSKRQVLVELEEEESRGVYTDPAGGPSSHAAGAARRHVALTKKQQLEEILSLMPDELTSFVSMRLPQEVKERYMGYPSVKPKEFFQKYPLLFEVQECAKGAHTFYVRRLTRFVP